MIKNKQLQEFLKDYSDDAEVIIMSNNKREIKHVGMAHDKVKNNYKIVLASEVPTHCCNVCGENVYRDYSKEMIGYTSSVRYYCPTCDCYRTIFDIIKL